MKLAIFGGTFDPIHSAHLIVAREAAEHFALDRVLFIPAGNPPHKHGTATSFDHRHRMVELACYCDPRFIPSRMEEGRQKSYSFDTIQRVRQTLAGGDQLYFLIGADAFAEIESWHRWREVLEAVEFIVVTRPGHSYDVPNGARVHRLETLALPVSSSDIRAKLAAGKRVPELPAKVAAYIRQNGLYR